MRRGFRLLWWVAAGAAVGGCGRSGTWLDEPAGVRAPFVPVPQPRTPAGPDFGSGDDGVAIVTSDANLSLVSLVPGRGCADAVWYPVASLAPSSAVLGVTPASSCLAPGDEVLLINLRGAPLSTANSGVYESLRVEAVNGSSATFTTSKLRSYGSGVEDDAGIGAGATDQHVVVQRVPNYQSLDVLPGATVTVDPFDGFGGGVLAMRVLETATIGGAIDLSAGGFRGAVPGGRRAENIRGPLALGGGGGGGGSGGHNGTNACGASGFGADGALRGYCGNASTATYSPCPAILNMCGTNGCGGAATGAAGGGGAGYGFSAATGGVSPGSGGIGGNKVTDVGQGGGNGTSAGFAGGGGSGGRDSGGGGGGGQPFLSFLNESPADLSRLLPGGGAASGAGGGGGGGAGDFQCANGGSGGSAAGVEGARGVDNCAAADSAAGSPGTSGNAGGGIVVIVAKSVVVTGTIAADGGAGGNGGVGGRGAAIGGCNTGRGAGGGGGGGGADGAAGGSIFLAGSTLDLGSDRVTARGGAGGAAAIGGTAGTSAGSGGTGAAGSTGSVGAIAIHALDTSTGSTLPPAATAPAFP